MEKTNIEWSNIKQVEYDDADLSIDTFKEKGSEFEKAGFVVINRKPNQLLLDLDSTDALTVFRGRSEKIKLIDSITTYKSKSGNTHAIVQLKEAITEMEAIALQAILGSDPLREYLSFLRFRNGVKEPTRLFKPTQSTKGEPIQ
jgi:hypothetical protein